MGIIYRVEGDPAEARRLFRKAVEMKPDFSSAYVNLALIERDEGRSDAALELLEQALAADPENAEAYAQRAVTHRLAGRFEQALEQYEKLCRCRIIRFTGTESVLRLNGWIV